jgi:hypothetical protein
MNGEKESQSDLPRTQKEPTGVAFWESATLNKNNRNRSINSVTSPVIRCL